MPSFVYMVYVNSSIFLEERTKINVVCHDASARANRKLHASHVEDFRSVYNM